MEFIPSLFPNVAPSIRSFTFQTNIGNEGFLGVGVTPLTQQRNAKTITDHANINHCCICLFRFHNCAEEVEAEATQGVKTMGTRVTSDDRYTAVHCSLQPWYLL